MGVLLLILPLAMGFWAARRAFRVRCPVTAAGLGVGLGVLGTLALAMLLLPLLPVAWCLDLGLFLASGGLAALSWTSPHALSLRRPWGGLLRPGPAADPSRLALAIGVACGALTLVVLLERIYSLAPARPSLKLLATMMAAAGALGGGWFFRSALARANRRAVQVAQRTQPAALLTFALLTSCLGFVAVETVVYMSGCVDDDYFIHAPMASSYERGVFPAVNPYLPRFALHGHYGRQLLLALQQRRGAGDICVIMLTQALVLQLASACLCFGMGRLVGGRLGGALSASLVMFGSHIGLGSIGFVGLVERTTNNNPVAYLGLFTILYLVGHVVHRRRVVLAPVGGLILGAYAAIYQTTFGVLGVALALSLPFLVMRSGGKRRAGRLVLMGATAVAVAAWIPGPISYLALRGPVVVAPTPSQPAFDTTPITEARLVSCAATRAPISFPKSPFLHLTSLTGAPLPLWDVGVWSQQGPPVWLFPLSLGLAIALGSFRMLPAALVGVVAVVVPATVGFGRFDVESLRFLFVLTNCAGLLAGMTVGRAWRWLRSRDDTPRRAGNAGLAIVCAAALVPGYLRVLDDIDDAWRAGYLCIGLKDHLVQRLAPEIAAEVDLELAARLREVASPGDRFLCTLPVRLDGDGTTQAVNYAGTIMSIAPVHPGGYALQLRGPTTNAENVINGARARAFWVHGDSSLLQDMRVRWLWIRSQDLEPERLRSLLSDPSFSLVERVPTSGPGGERLLLRFDALWEDSGGTLRGGGAPVVTWLTPMLSSEPGATQSVKLALQARTGESVELVGRVWLLFRIQSDDGMEANVLDWISVPLEAGGLSAGAPRQVEAHLVAPWVRGRYKVRAALRVDGRIVDLPGSELTLQVGQSS